MQIDPEHPVLGQQTPCLGCEQELTFLGGVLVQCREDSVASAVVVRAAAGIGKSRLRHEFLRRLQTSKEPLLTLTGRGDPMKFGAPYDESTEHLRAESQLDVLNF